MTPNEFQATRQRLGLSTGQLAEILGVLPRAVEAWEQNPNSASSRKPHPTACRVLQWLESGRLVLDTPEKAS